MSNVSVDVWTYGKGFNVFCGKANYPAMTLTVNGASIYINNSYAELLALQNLISERLADFRRLQNEKKEAAT